MTKKFLFEGRIRVCFFRISESYYLTHYCFHNSSNFYLQFFFYLSNSTEIEMRAGCSKRLFCLFKLASVHSEKAKPQAFVSLLADRQRDSAVKVHLQRTDYTTGPKEFQMKEIVNGTARYVLKLPTKQRCENKRAQGLSVAAGNYRPVAFPTTHPFKILQL